MNRFLTDEQAAYLSQLYTGTDAPKLHKAPTMYVHDLERRYAERGMTIQHLERLVHEYKEQEENLNYKLFEAMCSRNRADNEKMAADVARVHAELKSLRRGITIHRLERKLHKANRKHAALHRAIKKRRWSAWRSLPPPQRWRKARTARRGRDSRTAHPWSSAIASKA